MILYRDANPVPTSTSDDDLATAPSGPVTSVREDPAILSSQQVD